MTSENLNVRIIVCILISITLMSMNFCQAVLAQNSAESSQQQSTSDPPDRSDTKNDDNESRASDNSTRTTDAGSQHTSNDSSQSQNATSTDTQATNQTSATTDQGQASGNATDSGTSANSTGTESYQNNTSTEQQGNSTNVQSTNSTYSGNTTGTGSENSASYNSTQMMNENATISSNANLTDSVAVNQTTASLLPGDFDISIGPLTASIEAGASMTYSIIVNSINDFDADVSLAITSKAIPGITSSLSSNMTRPPINASSILFLNVQSEPEAQSGEYKLRVTASSANMSDSSASVTLEVIGKNVTLDQSEEFDPVALTPVLIKDLKDNIINNVSSKRMVLISTTVTNNHNQTQPFIAVVEVRDADGTTLYLQLQKGVLNPLGEVEVAISWIPDKAGTYQIRTFAIDEIKEDPEPLSAPVGKIVEVS